MNIDYIKIGSKWRCKVGTAITKIGGQNMVVLFIKEKPKKKKYLKVVDIWGDVIKCDFYGLDSECTFENLLEYFEEVKEES